MNVLFFARLREALGADSLELADAALPQTVAELRNAVIERAQAEAIDARPQRAVRGQSPRGPRAAAYRRHR